MSLLLCGAIFGAEGDIVWTRTHNGTADDWDVGIDIAVDESGNVYVTGYETDIVEGGNIWARKYDFDGNEVWTQTHNGTADDWDGGSGIAVDGNGNVYVVGWEKVTDQGFNIWVRKYDPNGNKLWTKTHNGMANDNDQGYGIAVDENGNVYVTGSEYVDGQDGNVWVRKYDSSGKELWTETYNGTYNGYDAGSDIAVDRSGNVYVIGHEWVTEDENNIWVGKYDSAGKILWTRTHSGTAVDSWDRGSGIAVDRSGNVYVTGWEEVTGAAGETQDIWVRKYDSAGNGLWTRTHNSTANGTDSGYDIAVDENGNVYVTGREWVTGERSNIWVRKYNSEGNEVWTKTYNGSANDFDEGFGIAVDATGNVYVTGAESVTMWDSNIWVRKYEGPFGEHFKPPVESGVKIQGGEKGYVNPKKGEKAKIHFQPSGAGRVNVKIYTLRGLLVWEKSKSVSGIQDFIEWNCRNKENDVVASGIYAVYVEGPGIKATKKVAILK
ncbi:hypothetical protein ES705_45116 [subsurface metagenome]